MRLRIAAALLMLIPRRSAGIQERICAFIIRNPLQNTMCQMYRTKHALKQPWLLGQNIPPLGSLLSRPGSFSLSVPQPGLTEGTASSLSNSLSNSFGGTLSNNGSISTSSLDSIFGSALRSPPSPPGILISATPITASGSRPSPPPGSGHTPRLVITISQPEDARGCTGNCDPKENHSSQESSDTSGMCRTETEGRKHKHKSPRSEPGNVSHKFRIFCEDGRVAECTDSSPRDTHRTSKDNSISHHRKHGKKRAHSKHSNGHSQDEREESNTGGSDEPSGEKNSATDSPPAKEQIRIWMQKQSESDKKLQNIEQMLSKISSPGSSRGLPDPNSSRGLSDPGPSRVPEEARIPQRPQETPYVIQIPEIVSEPPAPIHHIHYHSVQYRTSRPEPPAQRAVILSPVSVEGSPRQEVQPPRISEYVAAAPEPVYQLVSEPSYTTAVSGGARGGPGYKTVSSDIFSEPQYVYKGQRGSGMDMVVQSLPPSGKSYGSAAPQKEGVVYIRASNLIER